MEKLTPIEPNAIGRNQESDSGDHVASHSCLNGDISSSQQNNKYNESLVRLNSGDANADSRLYEDVSPNTAEQAMLDVESTYEFFTEEDERKDMVKICSRVSDYMHNNSINNLMLLDRSARPAYIGIKESWKRRYKDRPVPDIYFINPTGFVSRWGIFGWGRSETKIQQEFEIAYPRLSSHKDQPLLIFDNCIHSGRTIKPVIESLRQMGFAEVKIGVAEELEGVSELKADFVALDDYTFRCYSFGKDRIIKKLPDSVYSSPENDTDKIDSSVRLRKEILQIFREAPDEWFNTEATSSTLAN